MPRLFIIIYYMPVEIYHTNSCVFRVCIVKCREIRKKKKTVVEDTNVVKISKILRNLLRFQKAEHAYCKVSTHEFLPH
jgi:hypothetical protein